MHSKHICILTSIYYRQGLFSLSIASLKWNMFGWLKSQKHLWQINPDCAEVLLHDSICLEVPFLCRVGFLCIWIHIPVIPLAPKNAICQLNTSNNYGNEWLAAVYVQLCTTQSFTQTHFSPFLFPCCKTALTHSLPFCSLAIHYSSSLSFCHNTRDTSLRLCPRRIGVHMCSRDQWGRKEPWKSGHEKWRIKYWVPPRS